MVSSAHLPRPASLLAGAILLLVGLFAGACDQMTGSSLRDVEGPPEVDSAALGYSHMPTGTSLPSPREVPLKNGIVGSEEKALQPKSDSSGVESPYGCYLASDVSSDSTSSRSIYLYFPREIVEAAGTETKRTVYQAGKSAQNEWVRYASCVIPDASGARSLAREQIVRAGEKKALQETISDSSGTSATKEGPVSKSCTTFRVVRLDYCVGGPCCSETYCFYDVSYVTVCESEEGSGSGGGDDPYPEGGGGGSDLPGGEDDESCQQRLPEPGSECEPTDPCESDDPPSYCDSDVNENKVCPSDPLADMDIRPTCAGIEGGRFGEEARQDANGNSVAHWGLDLGGEIGTEVSVVEGGTVYQIDRRDFGWGNFIIIDSGGTFYLYAHLSKITVEEGEIIEEDNKIGEMGESGNAEDAECNPVHLHLEVREGDSWPTDDKSKRKDPEEYIGTEFSDDGEPVSDEC